jgi:hypothetical protein
MQNLHRIQKIEEKTDAIYPLVFQQNKGRELLSTFVILNNFALKSSMFVGLCSDAERRMWVRLESAILSVLKSDPTFLQAYIDVQDAFIDMALRKLGHVN